MNDHSSSLRPGPVEPITDQEFADALCGTFAAMMEGDVLTITRGGRRGPRWIVEYESASESIQ